MHENTVLSTLWGWQSPAEGWCKLLKKLKPPTDLFQDPTPKPAIEL